MKGQIRTIYDIYSKELGNKKFAKFLDLCEQDKLIINHIVEYYEKFKFNLDGYPMEFDKNIKDVNWYYQNMKKIIEAYKLLDAKQNKQ